MADPTPLKLGNIQGNILVGFNKDFQTFCSCTSATRQGPRLARPHGAGDRHQ